MKKIVLIIFTIFFVSTYAGEKVVPEKILNSWGYETEKIESIQYVKKIENLSRCHHKWQLYL